MNNLKSFFNQLFSHHLYKLLLTLLLPGIINLFFYLFISSTLPLFYFLVFFITHILIFLTFDLLNLNNQSIRPIFFLFLGLFIYQFLMYLLLENGLFINIIGFFIIREYILREYNQTGKLYTITIVSLDRKVQPFLYGLVPVMISFDLIDFNLFSIVLIYLSSLSFLYFLEITTRRNSKN